MSDSEWLTDARALHAECGVIDLHVDSILQQRFFRYDLRKKHRAGMKGQPLFWHADVPRMLEAGYSGACLGIHYWPREAAGAFDECMRQIDYLDWLTETDERCVRVSRGNSWPTVPDGRLRLAPGVEGCHMLNGSLRNLETLCDRGIAYLTLAHFSKNSAATPSMGRGSNEEDGLTEFGRDVVRMLNERSVVVDVSHLNQRCAIEAAELSTAPVFATHSGAQGVRHHPRLLSDETIRAIASGGGAIGVIFGPGFLAGSSTATSTSAADHIEYILELVGDRHVCTGSDYDGWLPRILADHRDCRDLVNVTAELLRRGRSRDCVAGVLSGNTTRVFAGSSE
ncbi:MAG: membrane dipeptidase [Bradymonadia bacterium]